MVTRMKGNVNSTRRGLRKVLNRLNRTATAIRVPTSSQRIPGISLVASVTPSASTSQRASN